MNKSRIGIALMGAAIVCLAACPAAPARALAIGAQMPSANVRMRNVDGRELTLRGAGGRAGTLVIFTCNHCPWAQAWESRIVAIGNDFVGQGGGVIAVNSNDPARHAEDDFAHMQERARSVGMRFPYVVDATSGVARAFGATRTPEVFLFDNAGRLVYHGAIDDNAHEPDQVQHHYLRDAITHLIASRPIVPNDTRSIGCTIKFRGESGH